MRRYFLISVLMCISFNTNAANVKYYKGEEEGSIWTGALFSSDSNGADFTFRIECDKEINNKYFGEIGMYIDEKYWDGAKIKPANIKSIYNKFDRASKEPYKAQIMKLCFDDKCMEKKWGFRDYTLDVSSGFTLKKSDHSSIVSIRTEEYGSRVYAKVDINRVIKRVCELKRSKIQSYSSDR